MRSSCRALLFCVLCLGLEASSVCAQPSARNVSAVTVDGRPLQGRLETITNGRLKLAGAEAVPLTNLLSVTWPGQPLDRAVRSPRILFANGDVASALPVKLDAESLTARWSQYTAWPEVRVPLEAVRGALVESPEPADERLKLFARVSQPTDKTDLVYLKNGDTLAGELTALAEGKLTVKQAATETSVPLLAVQAFSMNPELTSLRKLAGPGAIAQFSDGSRLHVRNLRMTITNSLLMETAFGVELDVPLSAMHGLLLLNDNIVYLSDLEPSSEKNQGYLGAGWVLRKDRNVQAGPLTMRGVEYAKGLGVHSRSEISWKLDGKFRRFQATVGLDDSAKGRGHVVFRVLVDGKPAYTSKPLTGTHEPLAIEPVDVTKAKSLTLIVDFGAQGDILDHANWCNACLVR